MANTPTFNDVNDLADAKDAAMDTMREAGRVVGDRLEQGRATAASGLGKAAAAVRDAAENFPGAKTLTGSVRSAADSLDSAVDYVRSNDANRMMSDVHAVVRRNPGTSLLIAAAVGFAAAKLMTGRD